MKSVCGLIEANLNIEMTECETKRRRVELPSHAERCLSSSETDKSHTKGEELVSCSVPSNVNLQPIVLHRKDAQSSGEQQTRKPTTPTPSKLVVNLHKPASSVKKIPVPLSIRTSPQPNGGVHSSSCSPVTPNFASPHSPLLTSPATPSSPRSRMSAVVSAALCAQNDALPNEELQRIALAIVDSVMLKHDRAVVGDAIRMIVFHLKDAKNDELRSKVLTGAIKPAELAEMKEADLVNPEERQKREAAFQERIRDHNMEEIKKDRATPTFLFKCPKCGARESSLYQLQMRGGDEPMTNILTCLKCGTCYKR